MDAREMERIAASLATDFGITVVREDSEPWSPDELATLRDGVHDLSRALRGPARFIENVGSLTVRQVEMRARGLTSCGEIKFTAAPVSIDRWTVVHELAHAWDANQRWRLSDALQAATGGYTSLWRKLVLTLLRRCDEKRRLPGCNRFGYFYGGVPPAGSDRNFNRREDLAESVAAYVYPSEAQRRVSKYRHRADYQPLLYYADYTATERWAFIDRLMRGEMGSG